MSADRGERIVVVGTGGAGLRAAERVRELNFAGELMIIGEEPYRPYHRPMLSKQVLTGSIRPRDVLLPTHSDLEAMWRPKTRVSRLDAEEHIVYLPGGEQIDYDGLIIATGMQAAHLPGAPRHDPRIHVLRTVADALAVQKQLARGNGRVALVGGGFLAGEVASAARELGRDTTIIIREPSMLANVPGYDVGETTTALHEAHGVRLVTEATVSRWHTSSADSVTMHLSTGEVVVADCVVLCVGGVPATEWLRGSGLLLDDGVLCEPTTHARGADDVVVAGDVARWPNLRFDTVPRRVEHWMNAVEMGRAAAESLLVGREAALPFTPLPKFWSEQHGVRIQGAGIPALAQDTVPLTDSGPINSKVTGYVAGGSLVGVLAWDSPRGMLHWSGELERQTTEAMLTRNAQPQQPAGQPAPQAGGPPPGTTVLPSLPVHAMRPGAQQSSPGMPPAMPPQAGPQMSNPGMPPAGPPPRGGPQMSNPGMPPVGPQMSNPGMPPVRPQVSGPGMPPAGPPPRGGPQMSNPGMPPVRPQMSGPGMPPVGPQQSSPGMPPAGPPPRGSAQMSNPGMPPAGPPPRGPQASNPGMPPAGPPPRGTAQASNPGMPPAGPPPRGPQMSNPGMPPAGPPGTGYAPMYAPLHASMTGPIPGPIPNPVPVPIYDPPPAQYGPPMSGSAQPADPAVMELPPIETWRQAS